MAVFLPVIAALLLGGSMAQMAISSAIATTVVIAILWAALRFGSRISALAAHQSDEVLLLTTFGAVLLVSGIAQRLQVSAAIGAFLIGIALSGPIATQSHRLLTPLRDLLAAMFFFFFGLQVAPATLPRILPLALLLAAVTAGTKLATGMWGARHGLLGPDAGFRAGSVLVARGEFSIVLAQLGTRWEPSLEPLAAAYVLLLAVLGPLLTRFAHSRVSSKPRSGMLQCKVSEAWPCSAEDLLNQVADALVAAFEEDQNRGARAAQRAAQQSRSAQPQDVVQARHQRLPIRLVKAVFDGRRERRW